MDTIANLLSTAISYIKTIGIADAVDILIVAYLIYKAIEFIRKTNSKNVVRGIMFLVVILLMSYVLGLTMLNPNCDVPSSVSGARFRPIEAFQPRNWRLQFLMWSRPVRICLNPEQVP